MQGHRLYIVIALGLAGLGCQGTIAEPGAGPGGAPGVIGPNGEVPPASVDTPWVTPESSMRRLTRREYAASIQELLGFEPERAYEYLPSDGREPFDNNSATQGMSETLASGAERLAMSVAADVVADEVTRAALMPCEPSGPSDAACFREFVEAFVFRAFRRPLETEEIDRFAALSTFAEESGDFFFGVETVISAVLQDPRFLFRLEIGEPTADDSELLQLDVWEVASRLSFLIWGAPPNDWLLQQVRDGRLATAEGTRDVASEMLADERTLEQAVRYHEQWLDFELIGGEPEMAARFRKEVDALVLRVVGENRPWMEILTLEEAYIDATLAAHYGVDAPDAEGFDWVSLSETDRGGLLGQGAFLSTEAQRAETDVTGRGMEIRSRLFCQELVIPADVDVDNLAAEADVDPDACTPVRLAAHTAGGCEGCHARLDPIGFGLDQYDMTGGSRTHESGKPECVIDGQGQVAGVGSFAGSAELGRLMTEIDDVRACFVQQMQRFSSGRAASTAADESLARRLAEQLGDEPTYQDAILALVSHPSFAQRRLETEGE